MRKQNTVPGVHDTIIMINRKLYRTSRAKGRAHLEAIKAKLECKSKK